MRLNQAIRWEGGAPWEASESARVARRGERKRSRSRRSSTPERSCNSWAASSTAPTTRSTAARLRYKKVPLTTSTSRNTSRQSAAARSESGSMPAVLSRVAMPPAKPTTLMAVKSQSTGRVAGGSSTGASPQAASEAGSTPV